MAQFEPPPTYADVIIMDEKTGKGAFNPLWLRWFLDLAAFVKAPSGSGPVTILDDASGVLSNRSYGEFPLVPAGVSFSTTSNDMGSVLTNRNFVLPVPPSSADKSDIQVILSTQVFGN